MDVGRPSHHDRSADEPGGHPATVIRGGEPGRPSQPTTTITTLTSKAQQAPPTQASAELKMEAAALPLMPYKKAKTESLGKPKPDVHAAALSTAARRRLCIVRLAIASALLLLLATMWTRSLSCFVFPALAWWGGRAAAQAPTVTVDNGVFVGVATSLPDGEGVPINRFLGLPYAVTPPLRFAPPEKAPAGSTVRDASDWGPACLQQGTPVDLPGVQPLSVARPADSEDCLYVNVWTPSSPAPKGGRTVMFWIYGGAFVTGRSSQAMYDGARFAATQDVVLVSFNYRLNAFGFPGPVPGIPTNQMNVGMLDTRLAIDWTKRNIAAFGGDPSKITIFGESAGAILSDLLALTTPSTNPPFRAMIFESGMYSLAGYGGGLLVDQTNTSSTSMQALSLDLGCGWNTTTLSCLRALPASTIKANVDDRPRLWGPIPDNGAEVPVGYHGEAVRQTGGGARVPLLTGTNANEGVLFLLTDDPATFAFMFARRFPELQPYEAQIRAAYPIGTCSTCWPNEFMAVAMVSTDYMFTCLVRRQANANANSGVLTYRYHYSLPIGDVIPDLAATVPHAFELPQVFGTYYAPNATDDQESVSRVMMKAWADFAKDPLAGPGWGAYKGLSSGNVVGEIGGSLNPGGEAPIRSEVVDRYCGLYEPLYEQFDPSAKKGKGRFWGKGRSGWGV